MKRAEPGLSVSLTSVNKSFDSGPVLAHLDVSLSSSVK